MFSLLLSALLSGLPSGPVDNPIAPLPLAALKTTSVMSGKLSASDGFAIGGFAVNRGQASYGLKLKPHQSLMAVIRAVNPGLFKLTITDKLHKPLTSRHLVKVGAKVILPNRLRETLEVDCVVSGHGSFTDEPYELIFFELDTEAALAAKL